MGRDVALTSLGMTGFSAKGQWGAVSLTLYAISATEPSSRPARSRITLFETMRSDVRSKRMAVTLLRTWFAVISKVTSLSLGSGSTRCAIRVLVFPPLNRIALVPRLIGNAAETRHASLGYPDRRGGAMHPNRSLTLAVWLLLPSITFGAPPMPLPKMVVAGDSPRGGLYDPTVEFAEGSSVGWLAYSAVSGSEDPYGPNVEIHLAKTEDAGATWTFVKEVNASSERTEVTLADGKKFRGQWNYEVPSLTHDPTDTAAPWKILYHRIFREIRADGSSANVPAASWIGMRTAVDPNQDWSDEVVLFRGLVPLPDGRTARVNLSRLDRSLKPLLVYSEPGVFASDGRLFVSLTGLIRSGSDRIVLLASDDNGATWRFVSTLLSRADAKRLGYKSFDGTSIVRQGERLLLLASPMSGRRRHSGTQVFEFEDLAKGTIVRGSEGAPAVRAHYLPPEGFDNPVGGGQADYHESNRAGGLLVNQLTLRDRPEIFQIRKTGTSRLLPASSREVPETAPEL